MCSSTFTGVLYKVLRLLPMKRLKDTLKKIVPLLDILAVPFSVICCLFLKAIRRIGVERMPLQRRLFAAIGVFPIRDHFYEPLFNMKHLKRSLRKDRSLPGIDFNDEEQLRLLESFDYNHELLEFPQHSPGTRTFYYKNDSFISGDAEFLYSMIRHFKPRRLFEVGSGHSTLMMLNATTRNKREDPSYECEHIAIEPFHAPWLEESGIKVIRQLVEDVDSGLFRRLEKNDILFIDSSHMIRPQGDVLFEYLELMPTLQSGVIVHVHDIFTPRDYVDFWVLEQIRFWNEQYLLEAFLTFNKQFRIIGALNYLHHHHRSKLLAKCPFLALHPDERDPGSFWMVRV